jgi:hypothetical protein
VVLKIMGIRNWHRVTQDQKGMVKNCVGIQGPQYTVALAEEEEEKKQKKKKERSYIYRVFTKE